LKSKQKKRIREKERKIRECIVGYNTTIWNEKERERMKIRGEKKERKKRKKTNLTYSDLSIEK
jgi:hypothetical protein